MRFMRPRPGAHDQNPLRRVFYCVTFKRCGIQHLKVRGKGGKVRYLPLHSVAARRINQYLESSEHHLADRRVPLFIPFRGKLTGAGITANGIYTVVAAWASMDFGLPRPPMPWSMKPTSPKSRPGWVMPISAQPRSMIAGRTGRRIRRPTR